MLQNDDYTIEGFTSTVIIQWWDFFGSGGLILGEPMPDLMDVDSLIAIKNSTISYAALGVGVGLVKELLIEDSMMVQNNYYGIFAETSNVTIVNSIISHNGIGIVSFESSITL